MVIEKERALKLSHNADATPLVVLRPKAIRNQPFGVLHELPSFGPVVNNSREKSLEKREEPEGSPLIFHSQGLNPLV